MYPRPPFDSCSNALSVGWAADLASAVEELWGYGEVS